MKNKNTVLIVDDNRSHNSFYVRELEDMGYEVRPAFMLAEAKRQIESVPPDVILLEVHLPDGSGIDLCREIREVIPSHIIFMTTTPDFSVELECLEAEGTIISRNLSPFMCCGKEWRTACAGKKKRERSSA